MSVLLENRGLMGLIKFNDTATVIESACDMQPHPFYHSIPQRVWHSMSIAHAQNNVPSQYAISNAIFRDLA